MMLWLFLACGPSSEDIIRNLDSTNPVVREDSAKIARNVSNSPEMRAALIKVLDEPSTKGQINAIESLVELEAIEAVPKLCEMLANPLLPKPIQKLTVDALGRLRSPEAVLALIAFLERDVDTPSLDAIWALGYIGDMRSLEVLSTLRQHSDPYVVYNATVALRELRP